MKHLFVPYEIALQLKEKGFDEKCFAYYNPVVDEGSEPLFLLVDNDLINFREVKYPCVKAPLWQQVIEWFREKYEIYIWITPYESQWYQFYISVNRKRTRDSYLDLKLSYFNTYLEALNKAIEEALKLI